MVRPTQAKTWWWDAVEADLLLTEVERLIRARDDDADSRSASFDPEKVGRLGHEEWMAPPCGISVC